MKPKTHILVASNTLTSIQTQPYMSHMNLMYRLGKDYPQYTFGHMVSHRCAIDRFRNMAGQAALQIGAKYVFFIDDDMSIPKDAFGRLLKANLDIVMAHVYIRGYPFKIMAFKYDKKKKGNLVNLTQEDLLDKSQYFKDSFRRYPTNEREWCIKCDAVGTATCLIKTDLFKRTPMPWFATGPENTEDIFFCIKATENKKNIKIGMHVGVVCGHLLDPEFVSANNRAALMTYYESFMSPGAIEMTKFEDRGAAYVEENIPKADVIATEPVITFT